MPCYAATGILQLCELLKLFLHVIGLFAVFSCHQGSFSLNSVIWFICLVFILHGSEGPVRTEAFSVP